MPIIENSQSILIAHPIAGLGLPASKLGQMSLEFGMYLNHRRAHERVNPDTVTQPMPIPENQHVFNFTTRCILSGYRCYRPAICTQTGQLTQYGLEMAQIAHDWSLELIEETRHTGMTLPDPRQPETFQKAEDIFISAVLPLKSLRLLAAILDATREAEFAFTQQKVQVNSNEHKLDILAFFREEQQKAQDMRKAEGKLERTEEEKTEQSLARMDLTRLDTPLTYNMRNTNSDNNEQSDERHLSAVCLTRDAYVPTASFDYKLRNVLKPLTKFGLVDTRVFSTGGRGRPPNIVRASVTGTVLIDDLRKRGLI